MKANTGMPEPGDMQLSVLLTVPYRLNQHQINKTNSINN